MKYSNYQVEDFILDESFQLWVKGSDKNINSYWELWISENPYKKETVDKAREILLNLEFREKPVKPETIEEEWLEVHNSLKLGTRKKDNVLNLNNFQSWQKIAASIVLVLAAGLGIYFYNLNQYASYTTAYGETKSITLPDKSLVTLNGNSKLSFKKGWNNTSTRLVNLKGEAFFAVTHKSNNQKFIVQTGNLKVIVLGTEFNVNSRRGKVKVVLNSGKVQLLSEHDKNIVMKPGELVQYSTENENYFKEKVIAERYSSWRNNRLEFENTPISEIAQVLEDNYGVNLIIGDKSIGKRKLTGSYPADDINIIIKAMAGIFNLNITKQNNQFILEPKM